MRMFFQKFYVMDQINKDKNYWDFTGKPRNLRYYIDIEKTIF